jgi:PadR family transcriptional regulator, regulatory protein PadR
MKNKNDRPEQNGSEGNPEEPERGSHGREHHGRWHGGEHGLGEHRHGLEGGRGEHGHGNFWHDWRSERHHFGWEGFQTGQALSPKEMEAWREFFHKTFSTWPEEHWIFGGRRFSPWHQGIDTFNPFVANLLSKGGGLLPLYVLHFVAQKPRYGNEIMDLLAQRTNGQLVANPGAIYPLLTLLEHEGFITGEWEDPDKRTIRVYSITASGLEEVSRIKTIVLPKIAETVQVLQNFLEDLQDEPAESRPTVFEEQSSN